VVDDELQEGHQELGEGCTPDELKAKIQLGREVLEDGTAADQTSGTKIFRTFEWESVEEDRSCLSLG
jgi:hypothetical protein